MENVRNVIQLCSYAVILYNNTIYYPIMNAKNFKTNSFFFSLLFNYQNLEYELINEQSGEGLCPYDPTHLSTATFFGEFMFYCIDIFVKI
jgi:hypothetical protein